MTNTLHESAFDVRGLFTLTVPELQATAPDLALNTPIKLSISISAVANPLTVVKCDPTVKLSPSFSAIAQNLSYDIGRGDLRCDISCIAPSLMIKLRPGIPNAKTVEFGAFAFTYARRESPDDISIDTDERFSRFGVNEPKIYTRIIHIIAESNDLVEYGQLKELIGLRRTLSVYGFQFDDAYISKLSDYQKKPGLGRWVWNVEFTCHKFQSVDNVQIDGLTLPTVISVSEIKKSPAIDDDYTRNGVQEPIGYSASCDVEFVDFHGETASQLNSRIGKPVSVLINGNTYQRCKITGITSYHPKGGGLVSIFLVNIQWYHFSTENTVTYGNITLSNPLLPNAHDITPEYSVDMSVGINVNPIPVITKRFAVQCITESPREFESLVESIGTKQTLTINGNAYPLCYVSSLSALQPRGGGDIWKYTIEFSNRSGESLATVVFGSITLPNCTFAGEEEIDIQSNRTRLYSGKVIADIGQYPARRFVFSCMSNSRTEYDALYDLISQKLELRVDGDVIPKAYISSLGLSRRIGDGTTRLYVFSIGFEEDTS